MRCDGCHQPDEDGGGDAGGIEAVAIDTAITTEHLKWAGNPFEAVVLISVGQLFYLGVEIVRYCTSN